MKRVLSLLLLVGLPALADTGVPGIYNTGVDNLGKLVTAGSADPHYQVTSLFDSGFYANGAAVVINPGWPLSPGTWQPNTGDSQWIGPIANAGSGSPPQPGAEGCAPDCNYQYQTTFNLASVTSGASLTGQLVSDNATVEISLNSSHVFDINGTNATDDYAWSFWQPFTVSSGLQTGLNTLDFVVNNWGNPAPVGFGSTNPTGLQVEFTSLTGATTSAPVPEPSAISLLAVMGGVLLGLAGVLKRNLV